MIEKNATVLIIEDDTQIRNFIFYTLKQEGFSCFAESTAQGGMSVLVTQRVDVMLLDLGLPDFDGMEVIKKVRGWSEIPIIVVSARDQDKEKVAALDAGADDYLTKPFSATELLARIRVAMRHMQMSARTQLKPELAVGELLINLDTRQVFLAGNPLHVTPLEYSLLSLFFKNAGKVLTTQHIIREIYGVGYGTDTQALRALMAGLRRKIEPNTAKPRYIMTEIGVGYRLASE